MTVSTDLEARVTAAPFDPLAYEHRLPDCRAIAQAISLVHVSGREHPFHATVREVPHEIPTSVDVAYCTDDTRRAESLLGLSPSAYFYAGRAHPGFGNVALAFAPGSEAHHTGSATPFDTGGLVHPNRYIKIQLSPADGEADESVMETLRRLQDEQEPAPPGDPATALDRFLAGPGALEPTGTPSFCRRMEQWVREQVGL
jgi:hypothetical protein